MKKLLCVGCAVVMALAANAAYTPVEWIKASGTQWVNTKYTPACTDKIEMKVKFATTDTTQALWCSRGTTTVKDTFTSFLVSGKVRVDRNNAAGASVDFAITAGKDYVITADYNARKATVSDGTTTKELTNLTDGTFTPGSPLSLFASHQAGAGLTDFSEMGNWGAYTLYYVKIYDKNGALVREYVPVKDEASSEPRCTVGLYETVKHRFCPSNGTGVLTCGDATGAADFEAIGGDNEYVLTVANDTQLALTADHVAAAAGKTFVKAGGGTLYVTGDTMKDFPGDIRVRDGYCVLQSTNALGTAAGQTYVENGGTLVNEVSVSETDGSGCAFRNETIHLAGAGCDGWGAVQGKKSCTDFCRNIVLDGPARVRTSVRFDWRSTSTEMNWYPLEVVCDGGGFYLVNETFSHMGDIDVKTGYLELQSSITGVSGEATITVRTNASLGIWGASKWIGCKVVFEDKTTIKSTNGPFKYADTDNRNILSGPVTLQGATKNDLDKNTQYQFRGKLTGDGGIWGGKGGYLQLINNGANDFKGGLDIAGVVENGNPVGGIVTYFDGNIPAGDGAGPLKLTNASLQQRNKATFHLPDVVADQRVVISNMTSVTSCSAKSLKKTGAGELTVFGPLSVAGKTEIDAGTLRLVAKMPEAVPGLYEAGNTSGQPCPNLTTEAGITGSPQYKGVCSTGMQYAYTKWSGGKGYYDYVGNFKVPGEAGTSARCRFSSSVYRYVKLWIDGTLVLQIDDSKVVFPSDAPAIGWSRHYWSDPVTLTAGWHSVAFYMQGDYSTDNGPHSVTGTDATKYGAWPDNFGLGVDFNSTETLAKNAKDSSGAFVDTTVSDSSRYVKFTDPGDGSFLRATLDADKRAALLDESKYRATFAGNVAFGPGAVFDIGDVAPYLPVTVPSLTGLPTVRNGELKVTSSTWTLRANDLVAGATPLTVGANAKVSFPANVTIAGDASALAYKKSVKARALIAVEQGGSLSATTFTLSDDLKAAGFTLTLENGVPVVGRDRGMTVFIK